MLSPLCRLLFQFQYTLYPSPFFAQDDFQGKARTATRSRRYSVAHKEASKWKKMHHGAKPHHVTLKMFIHTYCDIIQENKMTLFPKCLVLLLLVVTISLKKIVVKTKRTQFNVQTLLN